MNQTVVSGLLNNMILLLAVGIVCFTFPLKNGHLLSRKILIGVVIGLTGCLIMFSAVEFEPGVFADGRSVLLSTAVLFLGSIPGIIAGVMMVGFRIYMGGIGLLPGVLMLAASYGIGFFWRRLRFRQIEKGTRWVLLELFILGVAVEIGCALTLFTLPADRWAIMFTEYELARVLLFPASTMLLGGVFLSRHEERRTMLELEKEKELFKTTLLSVGDGVISTDAQGRIQVMNEVACRLTGWTMKEALGRPFEEVFQVISERTEQPCENPVQKVLDTGAPIAYNETIRLISKNGESSPITESTAPIKSSDGAIQGAVLVFRDISEEQKFTRTIEYISYHDQLTGLYNRRYLEFIEPQLDQFEYYPLAIVMADINGLKLTNDAFGHACGDNLLIRAAEMLKSVCRSDDVVIRLGGDEFLILLPRTRVEHVERIVNRICYESERILVGSINLSISFGWQVKTNPEDSFTSLFKKAEDQMYRNKLFESPLTREKIIQTIQNTLNSEYPNEERHAANVSDLCYHLAHAAGMTELECTNLRIAGLYHDIGKIAVGQEILNKREPLTESDWAEIKRHCETGYRILSSVNEMSYMAEYVLAHHERWDGKGYPKGLKESEIPRQAQVIALAEAYDAMTNPVYRGECISPEEAASEIHRNAGTQFDPHLAKLFVEKVAHKNWHASV